MSRHKLVAPVLLFFAFTVLQCTTIPSQPPIDPPGGKGPRSTMPLCGDKRMRRDITQTCRPTPIVFPPGVKKMVTQNFIALTTLRNCPDCPQAEQKMEPAGSGGFACSTILPVKLTVTKKVQAMGYMGPIEYEATPDPFSIGMDVGECIQWQAINNTEDAGVTPTISMIGFIDSSVEADRFTPRKSINAKEIGQYCNRNTTECTMYLSLPEGSYQYFALVTVGGKLIPIDPELVVECSTPGGCGETRQ